MLGYKIPTGAWTKDDGSALLDANGSPVIGWAGNNSNPKFNPDHIQGKNNADECGTANIGPLPPGKYRIHWLTPEEASQHAHLGPMIASLTPDPGNDMLGRGSFFVHGPAMDPSIYGQESRGCTVILHVPRQAVKDWGDCDLEVTA